VFVHQRQYVVGSTVQSDLTSRCKVRRATPLWLRRGQLLRRFWRGLLRRLRQPRFRDRKADANSAPLGGQLRLTKGVTPTRSRIRFNRRSEKRMYLRSCEGRFPLLAIGLGTSRISTVAEKPSILWDRSFRRGHRVYRPAVRTHPARGSN